MLTRSRRRGLKLGPTFPIFAFVLVTAAASYSQGTCVYTKSRTALAGYASGGPFDLRPDKLTVGRLELREFLWKHWHERTRAFAEVNAGTIDAGVVKALYVIQPDPQGKWGIDVELDGPKQPPCRAFHADYPIRVPIKDPNEDYPSQTGDTWPDDKIPNNRLPDSAVKDPKLFRVMLIRGPGPAGDPI